MNDDAAGQLPVGVVQVGKLERVLNKNPSLERVLEIIKAGLASTPFAGGIASLLSDEIPSARLRRLEAFAGQVAEDLSRLQNQVSDDRLETEDFAFMFDQCFRGVADNPQQEKIKAFGAMLVNSAIPGDLLSEEQEYFLNLVRRLSVLHLRILRFMAQPSLYLRDAGIPEDQIGGGFGQMFGVALPGVSSDVVKSAFGDLYDADLISTDKSIFGTMTSAQGLHLLGNRVTPLGHKFIGFCTL